ncbi:glycosyltransferase [Alkalihalobacillus deserti]|uniref:glycosyltransferase n=1 Tax=Alkalihalobacillus deserti TaxID=2879466 RepID=UPI001D13894D|nr:glycosyltransferase [Alkalihalobacillus deserti]
MKIILLAPANNVHTKKWLDFYNSKGIEVVNVSFDSHRDDEDRSKWSHVKTTYLHLKFANKLAYFLTIGQMKQIIKDEQPTLLHSHYISSYGVVGALTGFHPYVSSVWGSDIYDFPKEGSIKRKLVEFALSKSDVICSTSHVMKDVTAEYTDKEIDVTPFGVDMNTFKPLEKIQDLDKVVFGIVKTMKEKYGIRFLLEGYRLFKDDVTEDEYRKTKLVIVGGGPLLDEYKELSKKLEIDDQVTFTGNVPHHEVPHYINQIDLFFVPSTLDSESFGVAAVEAQACEVPVVVANVGGLPEVVKDGETGYVIPTKDAVAIATKMKELLNNEARRKELGKNGRAHVIKEYEWVENAERMLAVYERRLKEAVHG